MKIFRLSHIQTSILSIVSNKNLLNGALFALYSFINHGFGFILLLILANYISPSEYGYLSLFNTVIMLVGYFMAMSTQGYLGISYFKEGERQVKETFSCISLISILVSAFLILVLAIHGTWISERLSLSINVLYCSVLICFFSIFSNLNLEYMRIQTKVREYGVLSCGNALLNFVLSIILVQSFLLGWHGRVWAQLVCGGLFGSYGLLFFIKHGFLIQPSSLHLKKMLLWGIPLIPHLSTGFIRQGCDRYIINTSHTIEDVGYFSFALTLSTIISMVGFGFNQSNSVDIYKILSNKEIKNNEKDRLLKKQRHIYIKLYAISSLFIFVFCYFLIPLILPRYSESMRYFPILAFYGFLLCIYLVYVNFLFYFNKTQNIMYVTFGSAVLHLCLSLFVTRYNLYFTALLYVLTQLIVVLLIRYKAMATLKIELA